MLAGDPDAADTTEKAEEGDADGLAARVPVETLRRRVEGAALSAALPEPEAELFLKAKKRAHTSDSKCSSAALAAAAPPTAGREEQLDCGE